MEYSVECDRSQWLVIQIKAEKCIKEIATWISMRWSESKYKTSTRKQTLDDSSDPTAATNMVAELDWAKGHVAGPNPPQNRR